MSYTIKQFSKYHYFGHALLFFLLGIIFSEGVVDAKSSQEKWSLRRCVREALRRRPLLAGMRSLVKAKATGITLQQQRYLPSLLLKTGYRRLRYDYNPMSKFSMKTSKNDFSVGGAFRWDLTQNFIVSEQVTQARELYNSSVSSLKALKRKISLQVVLSYYQVLQATELRKVLQASLRKAKLHLYYAKHAKKAGKASHADILRAKMSVMQAQVQDIRSKTHLARTIAILHRHLGLSQQRSFSLQRISYSHSMFSKISCKKRNKLRPKEQSLKAKILVAQAKLSASWRAFLPSLGLIAGLDYQEDKFLPNQINWYAGVTISLPLSRYSTLFLKASKQRSELERAKSTLRSLQQDIALERKKSCLALKEAKSSILAAKAFKASASENLKVAEGRYSNGLASMLTLNDARTTLVIAQGEWIKSLFQVYSALTYDRFVRGVDILPSSRQN